LAGPEFSLVIHFGATVGPADNPSQPPPRSLLRSCNQPGFLGLRERKYEIPNDVDAAD